MKLEIDHDANHSLPKKPSKRGKRLRDFFLYKNKDKIPDNPCV